MVYTEIQTRGKNSYFYRVKSFRVQDKVKKEKIYLGKDLTKKQLRRKEILADKELLVLNHLLDKEDLSYLDSLKKTKSPENSRYEAFCSLFTFDSNAIEGNTLTLQETAQLLFESRTPRKDLREINEVLNHKKAFDYLLDYKGDLTKDFICNLHKIVIQNTLRDDLKNQEGIYRKVQVFIRGVEWVPTKPEQVPAEMKQLLTWYSKNKKKLHPFVVSAYMHVGFELIHPFVDGNGRVGRLLMNFILHKHGYPMINIPSKIRHKYYKTLEEAQIRGNLKKFTSFLLSVLKKQKITF